VDSRVFSAILPKSRRATRTHYLTLANSSFFFFSFLRNMANVLEVLFFNSFLKVTLGFFVASWRNFAKFFLKHYYIMWLFLCVQQNLNHMGCSDAIHEWMMGRMNGWKASWKTTTTSFNICNKNLFPLLPPPPPKTQIKNVGPLSGCCTFPLAACNFYFPNYHHFWPRLMARK
jgi:hypothetical protein